MPGKGGISEQSINSSPQIDDSLGLGLFGEQRLGWLPYRQVVRIAAFVGGVGGGNDFGVGQALGQRLAPGLDFIDMQQYAHDGSFFLAINRRSASWAVVPHRATPPAA